MTLQGKKAPVHAICEQSEWDAIKLARPGYHLLIKSGIVNEGEAERFARGATVAAEGEVTDSKATARN